MPTYEKALSCLIAAITQIHILEDDLVESQLIYDLVMLRRGHSVNDATLAALYDYYTNSGDFDAIIVISNL